MKRQPPTSHRKAIIAGIHRLAHRRSVWDIWRDWLEMSAIAMRNAVDRHGWQERETRYLQIIKGYERDEVSLLAALYAHLVMAMEFETGDVLGSIYMELDMGNSNLGQFFTPYEVCRLMAAMTIEPDLVRDCVGRRGYMTAMEPSCGGGAMLIALSEEITKLEYNPQQHLHITGVDIDIKAVHMCYLQLSLLHIPALIVHGNALTVEQWDVWPTPAHILGGWEWKLRAKDLDSDPAPAVEVFPANDNQPDITLPFRPTFGGEQVALF